MSRTNDTKGAARVQAAFTELHAEQATTDAYVEVGFEVGRDDAITDIDIAHAVSLELWAQATTQDSLIKVEHKVNRKYGAWVTLVAETALTAGDPPTVLYSDAIRTGRLRISIKESTAGGTVEVGGICK